jgi:hypothetical protein
MTDEVAKKLSDNPGADDFIELIGHEINAVVCSGINTPPLAISNRNFAKFLIKYVFPEFTEEDWETIEKLKDVSKL